MVDVVRWASDERTIPDEDVSGFYDAPLRELTIFHYKTGAFALPAHRTHFSLKLTLKGREDYAFGRRRASLTPGDALFANSGETHSSAVRQETECLSIYAPDRNAAAMALAALSDEAAQLDCPTGEAPAPLLAQTPLPMTATTKESCSRLLRVIGDPDNEDRVELAAAALIGSALRDAFRAAPPSALRNIRRRAVRDELIARLLRAKTLIDDAQGALYDLDRLASEACMSRYHFLRRFSELVGESPGAYARRRRLEAARDALARGEPAAQVARRAGYRSLRRFRGAFERAFPGSPAE